MYVPYVTRLMYSHSLVRISFAADDNYTCARGHTTLNRTRLCLQFGLPGNRCCRLRLAGLADPSINPLGNDLCEVARCRFRFVVHFVVHALTYLFVSPHCTTDAKKTPTSNTLMVLSPALTPCTNRLVARTSQILSSPPW